MRKEAHYYKMQNMIGGENSVESVFLDNQGSVPSLEEKSNEEENK